MKSKIRVVSNRQVRHARIRKKMMGTEARPRLNVYRSLKHFEAQLIDDMAHRTLVSLSTRDNAFASKGKGGNVKAAKELGAAFAKCAAEKGFNKAVLDRGGFLYTGRVKAFADAAREAGLNI
jgi:large subunit ribosomal protein L18